VSGIFDRNVSGSTEILQRCTVGIAGCGGLGSNAALALTRAGIGRLLLVDFDVVEESNLNRQQYYLEDVGKKKVVVLAERLRAINPDLRVEVFDVRLEPDALDQIFAEADLLLEAFDRAENKRWLIEAWCRIFPERPIVVASGVSGLGRTETLQVLRSGRIIVCGDRSSDVREGLCAPRVAIAANMEANEAVAWLVEHGPHSTRG